MDHWDAAMVELEERQNTLAEIAPDRYEKLKTYLRTKYVDDVLAAMERLKAGVYWCPEVQKETPTPLTRNWR